MYNNDALKCLTGEVRLSYANLVTPKPPQNGVGEPKYSVKLLIPKSDANTKADLEAAFKAAYEEGVKTKWNGKRPQVGSLIHDGDGLKTDNTPYGDECKGHWVLACSSKQKPQVVGISNIRCELDPNDIYSGMYARVTVRFFAYDTAGRKGVGCGLGNVLKTRDGEAFSGRASAESDFAGLEQAMPTAQADTYTPPWNPQAAQPTAPAAFNPLTGQWS